MKNKALSKVTAVVFEKLAYPQDAPYYHAQPHPAPAPAPRRGLSTTAKVVGGTLGALGAYHIAKKNNLGGLGLSRLERQARWKNKKADSLIEGAKNAVKGQSSLDKANKKLKAARQASASMTGQSLGASVRRGAGAIGNAVTGSASRLGAGVTGLVRGLMPGVTKRASASGQSYDLPEALMRGVIKEAYYAQTAPAPRSGLSTPVKLGVAAVGTAAVLKNRRGLSNAKDAVSKVIQRSGGISNAGLGRMGNAAVKGFRFNK